MAPGLRRRSEVGVHEGGRDSAGAPRRVAGVARTRLARAVGPVGRSGRALGGRAHSVARSDCAAGGARRTFHRPCRRLAGRLRGATGRRHAQRRRAAARRRDRIWTPTTWRLHDAAAVRGEGGHARTGTRAARPTTRWRDGWPIGATWTTSGPAGTSRTSGWRRRTCNRPTPPTSPCSERAVKAPADGHLISGPRRSLPPRPACPTAARPPRRPTSRAGRPRPALRRTGPRLR